MEKVVRELLDEYLINQPKENKNVGFEIRKMKKKSMKIITYVGKSPMQSHGVEMINVALITLNVFEL